MRAPGQSDPDVHQSWHPSTAGAFYQASECTFTVKPDAQNTKLGIGPGKAWGRVTCPDLADPQDPLSSCSVDVGYFILEDCRQQ